MQNVENTVQNPNAELNQDRTLADGMQNPENESHRIWYEQLLEKMRQRNSPRFIETLRVAELLSETNTLGVHRLIEVFGREFVSAKAEEAMNLFQEAKNRGPEAYIASKEGTAVATKKGQPRSLGGVFFYLMNQHAERLGVVWSGLNVPKPPNSILYTYRPQFPKVKVKKPPSSEAAPRNEQFDTETQTEKPVPITTVAKAANQGQSEPSEVKMAVVPSASVAPKTASIAQPSAQGSEKKANQPTEAVPTPPSNTVKPSRATLKVVGPIVGKPKPQPNGQVGIIELVLKSEMNQGLPKGLPNLGSTRVVVWCTEKQFNKIKKTVTPESRFIAEGEMAAAVGADLTPFVRLICMKLSTVEYDQALRNSAAQNQSVS